MQAQPPTHPHEPINLLWIGDATDAIAHFGRRAPHVRVLPAAAADAVAVLQSGTADLLVLDASQAGLDISAVLGQLQGAQLDTPVLLLTLPGGEDLAIQAGRFAVCDCVVKTADYLLQLLPAIGQLRARHDLVTLFRTNRQSQDRLRTILEFQPAVTGVINPDGIITAMNQAGLTLLGAAREQVVGRPFTSLLPDEARQDASAFLARVCRGEAADFDHVVRDGGHPIPVRTRAVPFRNGDTVVALVTVQERAAAAPATDPALEALSAAALAEGLEEIESLREQRTLWSAQRETYETRAREAAAHADAVMQQAQADAATLVKERAEWALERQQHAQRQREAGQVADDLAQATAALQHVHAELAQAQAALEPLRHAQEGFETLRADFGPLRAELDTLRAERGQWMSEHAAWMAERDQWLADRQQLESVQAQLSDAATALANERSAWAQERDNAVWQHQQALEAARWAFDQERQGLAGQLSDTQSALDAERQRSAALLGELQQARALADDLTAMQRALETDHAAMRKLRDDLLRFMADADSQCRTIIEHQEARLTPGADVRNQSFS